MKSANLPRPSINDWMWPTIRTLYTQPSGEEASLMLLRQRLFFNRVAGALGSLQFFPNNAHKMAVSLLSYCKATGSSEGLESIFLSILIHTYHHRNKTIEQEMVNFWKTQTRLGLSSDMHICLIYDSRRRTLIIVPQDVISSLLSRGSRANLINAPGDLFEKLSLASTRTVLNAFPTVVLERNI
jgi:hypothetical protein